MAVYNETFSGTQAVSGNFTVMVGSLSHVSDRLVGGTGGHNIMRYSAAATGADQYSEVVTAAGGDTADYAAVAVRCSGSGGTQNGYQYVSNLLNNADLQRFDNGVMTKILDMELYSHAAPGDTIRLEVSGTTLRVLINDVEIVTHVDATHASGDPGVGTFRETPGVVSWEGGDLGGGSPAAAGGFRSLLGVGR